MRLTQLSKAQQGFTLVEIMVVVAIVGLLSTIAVCNFVSARDNSRLKVIRHNLSEIESAKEQWAYYHASTATIADVSELAEYFHGATIKQVVQETYVPNQVGTAAEAVLPATVALGPYAAGASIPAP